MLVCQLIGPPLISGMPQIFELAEMHMFGHILPSHLGIKIETLGVKRDTLNTNSNKVAKTETKKRS